ncbi:helix-turn-helix transcriptional regulator [Photobacterium sp. SDRW27]|uniref:helix-turn-helix domain-containing protein n=1 Tax=Photobacterium obscurum TaxID=2829490 RepID=UPI0022449949|nr:helix-turn-helix transcriptional regulator [Photobacterium obscurum]MCW8329035.1 helix-turn-helix transcriptional regulator [Photobacterium obscurum]
MKKCESAPLPTYSIHKGWLQLLQKTAREYGLNCDDYFPPQPHSDGSQPLLDVRDVRQIHHRMFQDSKDPLFSVKASRWVSPLTFGSYTLTLWTAPNLKSLLKDACNFSVAIGSPIQVRLHETPQGDAELWIINNEPLNKESHVTYVGVTLYIATMIQIIRQASLSDIPGLEVKLIHWPFEAQVLPQFEAEMNCKISLGSPIRKLCIKRQHLFTPLATSDPEIYPSTRALLRKRAAELETGDVVLQVYNTLDKLPTLANISGEKVAAKMLISIRTLNRRLAEVNTCYRGVVEKYKLEKALHLLNQPNINMTEIAFQLGFSDLSTFSRAFKRWTGTSPTHLNRNESENQIKV